MADPIAAISGAIATIKRIADLANKIKDVALREEIVELRSTLVDIKEQVLAMREQNLQLESSLRAANEKPDLCQKIEVRDGVYYLTEPIDGRGTGPFCIGCFDSQDKLVSLTRVRREFESFGTWTCPVCNAFQ